MNVRVIGPRDRNLASGVRVVNTTSQSPDAWSKAFSPFFLGPVDLYGGLSSGNMENAWQFSKVYSQETDPDGNPSADYWAWASSGWAKSHAVRYPKGKGAKPKYLLWDGEKLDYISARKRVYFPLYRDAVRRTEAFGRLQTMAQLHDIALWDFDGYDHEAAGMSLKDVLNNERRPMGHAFVLKAMLIYGPGIEPDDIPDETFAAKSQQMSLI